MFEPIVGPSSPFLEEQGYVPCATVPSGEPEHLRYARDAWAASEPRMYASTRLPHHAQAMLLALILSWLGGLEAWWRGCRLSGGCWLWTAGRTRTGWCLSIATRNAARPRAQQTPALSFPTAEGKPRKVTQATHQRLSVHHNLEQNLFKHRLSVLQVR